MDKVIIRQYSKNDVASFYEAVIESKEEISEWLPWCNNDYSIADSEHWILNQVPIIWKSNRGCEFIITNAHNTVLGGCCLEQLDLVKKEASIGYWIRTKETRKGVATYACKFLFDFGFSQLCLEQIQIIASTQNVASMKVGEKSPYAGKVIVPKGFQIGDKISDAIVYTITRKSFGLATP